MTGAPFLEQFCSLQFCEACNVSTKTVPWSDVAVMYRTAGIDRDIPKCTQSRYRRLKKKTKLHGLSPRANYTDRATAACRRSDCQLLRIEGGCHVVSVTDPYDRILGFLDRSRYYQVAPQFVLTRLSAPRSSPTNFFL
jgi:hypothetical protein